MAEHYWTQTPASNTRRQTIHAVVRGVDVSLLTDSGVFSKERLDFGTRVLLNAAHLPEAGHIVDLGCGYGAVAAVLGRVYDHTTWTLIDVNARALELARMNVQPLEGRVEIVESDGFAAVPELEADAVLLNPPIRTGKSVIYRLFEEARNHLREDGALWIVIQKKQGAPSARAKLQTLFSNVEDVARDAGYHVYKCTTENI